MLELLRSKLKARTLERLQAWLSVALLLICAGLAAWLSVAYEVHFDLTRGHRHTLSRVSLELLDQIEGPVRISAFAREDAALRKRIRELVARYRARKPDIELNFLNPDAVPELTRKLGVSRNGEMIVYYRERSEHVLDPTERRLSNALHALARGGERWIVFLEGHGERKPFGSANHDLGTLGRHLQNRGFTLQTLNLAQTGVVPDNTTVLVIASPQVALLPGEAQAIGKYVEQGGNLIWFADPSPDAHGLGPLAAALGVRLQPGTVVDPASQLFGIDNPAFVVVTAYPATAALEKFAYATVFPYVRSLQIAAPPGWDARPLLLTGDQAWLETDRIDGPVAFDAGRDVKGPLTLGVSLSRPRAGGGPAGTSDKAEQRIVVLGDGDFAANTYIGNSGNLDLAVRLLTWLARDDALLNIPTRFVPDRALELPRPLAIALASGFLIFAPLALLGCGLWIWWRRRRRYG